jgi:hypothetical protein
MAQEPYIAGMKVDQVDYNRYQIFCSKGINLATWGEYITISFFDPQNGGTQIVVESKPKLPTTLVDWGHNEENVRIVMNYFYYLYPPTPAQPQEGRGNSNRIISRNRQGVGVRGQMIFSRKTDARIHVIRGVFYRLFQPFLHGG